MKEALDNFEDAVDTVIAPDRMMRWIVRVVLLIVLIAVGVTVGKIVIHMTKKVDQVTTDRDWFVAKQEEITSAELEEQAARDALTRHLDEVKERSGMFSFSRSGDRTETQRLNHNILAAQMRRLAVVREYNSRAGQITDKNILTGLPAHVDLSHDSIEEVTGE